MLNLEIVGQYPDFTWETNTRFSVWCQLDAFCRRSLLLKSVLLTRRWEETLEISTKVVKLLKRGTWTFQIFFCVAALTVERRIWEIWLFPGQNEHGGLWIWYSRHGAEWGLFAILDLHVGASNIYPNQVFQVAAILDFVPLWHPERLGENIVTISKMHWQTHTRDKPTSTQDQLFACHSCFVFYWLTDTRTHVCNTGFRIDLSSSQRWRNVKRWTEEQKKPHNFFQGVQAASQNSKDSFLCWG